MKTKKTQLLISEKRELATQFKSKHLNYQESVYKLSELL